MIEVWRKMLLRRWRVALFVFTVVFGTAAWSVLSARPLYRAETRLRLSEPPPSSGVGPTGGVLGMFRMGGDPFANDLELLSSRTVAERAARDVSLNASLSAPRGWFRDSLFTRFEADTTTVGARYEATWQDAGRIELRLVSRTDAPGDTVVPPFVVAPGEVARFGGVTAVFKPWRKGAPRKVFISTRPFRATVKSMQGQISTERTRREANVVQVFVVGADPQLARRSVEAALARFTELRSSLRRRESAENVDSLRSVASHTAADLRRAETALEQLKRETMLIAPDVQAAAVVERYSETTAEREKTRSHLATVNSVLARAGKASNPAERWTQLLAFPGFVENQTVGGLIARLNQLEERRADLSLRRTEDNRDLRLVLDQIAYLDKSIETMMHDMRETLTLESARQDSQLGQMDAMMASFPARTVELVRRERQVRLLSEMLLLTENRLRQEDLREALSFSNVQVIDPPALLYRPVWPRRRLGLAIGLAIAGMCAVLAVAVAERADTRVRTAADVQAAAGVPVLATAVSKTGGVLELEPFALRALLHHASANGRGPTRIVLAPVGQVSLDPLLATLRTAYQTGSDGADVLVAPAPDSFASASAASASGAPVTLVARSGRLKRAELQKARDMVVLAGGQLAGIVLICGSAREAEQVWS